VGASAPSNYKEFSLATILVNAKPTINGTLPDNVTSEVVIANHTINDTLPDNAASVAK